MLKGNGCSMRVVVAIRCWLCLSDCVGPMFRYREVGAIVAKQSSLSLSPATMYFPRGLFIIEWRVCDAANPLAGRYGATLCC